MQSNYYAAKVYAEHPLRLWPLDEPLTYVSALKNGNDDDLTLWTKSGVTSVVEKTYTTFDVPVAQRTFEVNATSSLAGAYATIISSTIYEQVAQLPFTVSAYVMNQTGTIQDYEIGVLTETVENSGTFDLYDGVLSSGAFADEWQRIHAEFNFISQRFKIFFSFRFYTDPVIPEPKPVYVNNMTAGEFALSYASYEDGIKTQAVPTLMAPSFGSDIRFEPAANYGFGAQDLAYYLVSCPDTQHWSNAKLLAKNDGIPMVFGASNSTTIYEYDGQPGLIVKGEGFLHERGRYNQYAIEFWLRQGVINKTLPAYDNSNNPIPQAIRIFGPINSSDGLWRDDTHIYIVIGDKVASYAINNWYRPLLITLNLNMTSAILLINGERVCSLSIDMSTIQLLDADVDDWLGFYNNGVDLMEIDAVSIFPYIIPPMLSKRRYALGQGVNELNTIERPYLGKSFVFDYPMSNYNRNLVYPDHFSWEQGQSSNLFISQPRIGIKDFKEAEAHAQKTHSQWLADQASVMLGQKYPCFKLAPNNQYFGTTNTLELPSLAVLEDGVATIVVEFENVTNEDKVFLSMYNSLLNEWVYIRYANAGMQAYILKDGEYIYSTTESSPGKKKMTINIEKLSSHPKLKDFFTVPNNVTIFLGGGDGSYTGRYFAVSYFNAYSRNVNDLDRLHYLAIDNATGAPLVGNYTYAPYILPGGVIADKPMAVGYWKDIVPLSYFAKEIEIEGSKMYAIDAMQFNSLVDDSPLAGLVDKVATSIQFVSTENSGLTDTANEYDGIPLGNSNILSLSNNFMSNIYSVKNGTVIALPETIDIPNTFVVIRMRIKNLGYGHRNIYVRKIELASMTARNTDGFFSLGSRYGFPIYPVRQSGSRNMYPTKMPLRITKETQPYLRLTQDSGAALVANVSDVVESGGSYFVDGVQEILESQVAQAASVPGITLKKIESDEYALVLAGTDYSSAKIAGFKFWMALEDTYTNNIINSKKIASVVLPKELATEIYEFWVVPRWSGRNEDPVLYFLEFRKDGTVFNDALLLQNVYQTTTPLLEPKRWVQISVVFSDIQQLVGTAYMNLFSGAVFQNISFHQPSIVAESEQTARRSWLAIKTTGGNPSWQYWEELLNDNGQAYKWSDTLYLSRPRNYFFAALEMTSAIFGTISIVADTTSASDTTIATDNTDSIMDVQWSTILETPV